MHLLTIILGLPVGLFVGLLGAGGSILTVPVLVYLLGHDRKVAIAESLGIVGTLAAVAVIARLRNRVIAWRSVVWFGPPSVVGTYLGAWLSMWFTAQAQMVLFALVVFASAQAMIRHRGGREGMEPRDDAPTVQHPWALIVLEGLGVGVITGLVGVGGGFMIVPALVLLGRMSMRVAIRTSLVLIAAKSLVGFAGYLSVLERQGLAVDWETMVVFIGSGCVGAWAGLWIRPRVASGKLRRLFGWFLLVVGLVVLVVEVLDWQGALR